jgi:hypothetical protein
MQRIFELLLSQVVVAVVELQMALDGAVPVAVPVV